MVLVEPAARIIQTPRALAVALVGVVGLSVPLFWALGVPGLPVPAPQWLFALPVYVLGLLLGLAHHLGRPGWAMLAAAVMSVIAFALSDGALWSFTIVLAVLAFEAFWRLPLRGRWLPFLGQAAFGIYLVHPFFLLVVYKLCGAEVDRALAAVLTFVASWAAVLLLRRTAFFVRLT
jgi:peptidoglycan/LPS O-acetylase OafA/YrhL